METEVNGHFTEVFQGFTRELFQALNPPWVNVDLIRFDGCSVGDEVHLKLSLVGLSYDWVSVIDESVKEEKEIRFVDNGTVLPPPLKVWQHTHRIKDLGGNRSVIIDNVYFGCANPLVEAAVAPGLYATFAWRKPIYKKHFR